MPQVFKKSKQSVSWLSIFTKNQKENSFQNGEQGYMGMWIPAHTSISVCMIGTSLIKK